MENILDYNLDSEEDLQIDYRNANYKQVNIKFDITKEIKDSKDEISIVLYQDFHLGKGGIFWDGV